MSSEAFKPHSEVYIIPGDSIEQSPAWVHETRRCFPLLPDEEIIQAFERLTERAQHFQDRLDMEVNAEAELPYCTCPEGADGNPCAVCGKPEAVTVWSDTKPFPPLPHEEC